MGPPFQLGRLAGELGVTLLVGSVAERCRRGRGAAHRSYNTASCSDPMAACWPATASCTCSMSTSRIRGVSATSDRTVSGDPSEDVVVADTELGRLGLSICYDLRFGELYREHVRRARPSSVPSAFTLMTGKDHWHALLRARAIEASAGARARAMGPPRRPGAAPELRPQPHRGPGGTVVAECGDGEGFCIAPIPAGRVEAIRRRIPMGANRRLG